MNIQGPKNRRGSALLITVILVVVILGLGAAFLSETVWRAKNQSAAVEADEALMICDAGLEKVRLALYQYRYSAENGGSNPWAWNDILQYCNPLAIDRNAVRTDFQARKTSTFFTAYRSLWGANTPGLNARMSPTDPANAAVPSDSTTWSSGDANLGVMIGSNQPYLDGAFWIHIRDNEDEGALPNDPLVDRDRRIIVTVVSTLPDNTQRQVEAVLEYDFTPMSTNGLAAVVSNANVELNGSITIDGNDFDLNGAAVPDNPATPANESAGVFGVLTDNTGAPAIDVGGGASVGGTGNAPARAENDGVTTKDTYPFPTGFPDSPDSAINLPPGTLKARAQRARTYFTSKAQFDAYVSANGNVVPGGQVIYLEVSGDINPFELGTSMNAQPSILVVRSPAYPLTMANIKNVHGDFKGLLMADQVTHVNAGTNLLGSVMALGPVPGGNKLGNGNSTIKFSSAVLANLPQITDGAVRVLSWRKVQ